MKAEYALDPGGLAHGTVAGVPTAVVDSVLTLLRGLGEVRGGVAGVPDLVRVAAAAGVERGL